MLNIWKKIFKTGVVTERDPFTPSPPTRRGKLTVDTDKCTQCEKCVSVCPVDAISLTEKNDETIISFDYGKCMYCGLCVETCPDESITHTSEVKESVRDSANLIESFSLKKKLSKHKEGV